MKSKILNDKTTQTILKYIADGNYLETACVAAGITRQTYFNWLHRAEAYDPDNGTSKDKIYFDFFDKLKDAEARAEANIVKDVRLASKKPQYWAAGMTMLERRHRDRWGRQDTPIVESKVLIALQDRAAELKGVKLIPQEGVTDKNDE